MEFEWDEAKRRRNLERHDIDFVRASLLFNHPNAVHMKDERRDYGEGRFILLCEEGGQLFHVTYTMREKRVRIISARQGNKRERRRYEQAQEGESGKD